MLCFNFQELASHAYSDEQPLLLLAIMHDQLAVAQILLAFGVDIDCDALHFAAAVISPDIGHCAVCWLSTVLSSAHGLFDLNDIPDTFNIFRTTN